MKHLSIRKRWLTASSSTVALAAVAAVASGVFAAPAVATRAHAAAATPLVMESSQGVSLSASNNMNPYPQGSAATQIGATSLIYEDLMQFDIAKPTQKPYPFLATSYAWGAGGKSITFQIRQGVKWSNGAAFTAADVAGTYNMLVKYPDTNTSSVGGVADLTGATASGNAVTLDFLGAGIHGAAADLRRLHRPVVGLQLQRRSGDRRHHQPDRHRSVHL